MKIDLTKREWRVAGWRPYTWMMRRSLETGGVFQCDVGPVPATVPGSVQSALLAAGLIEDFNLGLNSLKCEWIEHRHWEFFTELEPIEGPVELQCDGLDHSGWIVIDANIAATFEGSLLRHRFDLTKFLADGKPHRLSIIFDEPPREQGQLGFTSRSKHFKPRFSYSWDWVPRIVTVGIHDRLRFRSPTKVEVIAVTTELGDDLKTGRVNVRIHSVAALTADVEILNFKFQIELPAGESSHTIRVENISPWWPNGAGDQPLYPLRITVSGEEIFSANVGFKQIRWLPCEGALPDAEPWICEVNGKPIFLQGVNWSPVRADWHNISREQYAKLIQLYKQIGCNIFRVWGGAYLEREDFYDLCDRAGILVWQEFPLSSSGVDNYAPDDPAVIEKLCTISTDYVRRRAHHACKLLWCGGNELYGERGRSGGKPHDLSHSAMAALSEVVKREDPHTRFVPSSPSGPRFSFDPKEAGQGVHHDTHGPWNWDQSIEKWREYWTSDDSMLRSEVGMPSASHINTLEQFRGEFPVWPPDRTNPYWVHSSAWWIQWDQFKDAAGDDLEKFVALSQKWQADLLAIAAASCKSKFPRCGGFMIWMGHDCFPCPSNTAVIDFNFQPKPAYHALAKIFLSAQPPRERSSSR